MRKLRLLIFLIAVSLKANAQTRIITGKILSTEDNKPLPGVAISTDVGGSGSLTDSSGSFSLEVPAEAKELRFDMLGHKSKIIRIGAENTLNVSMDVDTDEMKEVVVTALGIERNTRSLGYSITKIGGKELVESREVNVVQALAGKVAGVQINSGGGTPGASSKIIIRGNKSFDNNQPLFVIDGIPMDNNTNSTNPQDNPFNENLEQVNYSNRAIDINPDDIENMTVLKGPAAAALYGVRAGNGAIIITTKKGSKNQKPSASFGSNVDFSQINRVPNMQLKYAQGSPVAGTPTYQTYLPGPNGIYEKGGGDDVDGSSQSWGPTNQSLGIVPVDNVKKFYKTGYTYTNNFSISAGTEKSSYRLSLSNLNQSGIIPNSDFKRFSIRLTASSDITKNLTLSGTANFITSAATRTQQGSNLSGTSLTLFRAPSSFDLSQGYEYPYGTGVQRTYLSFYDNPYFSVNESPSKDNTNRMIGNINATYSALPWLKFVYRVGTDFYSDNRKSIFAIGSNNSSSTANGQITENSKFHRELYQDFLITANKDFAKFSSSITIGNNLNEISDNNILGRGRNLAIPKFYNLSNASDRYTDQNISRIRSAAFLYDINTSYNNIVFLGTTGRLEYSSTFGPNRRQFFFPSVNAAIVFTENTFFKQFENVFSFGKIRLSLATAANRPSAYSAYTTFNQPFFTDGFVDGFSFPYAGQAGYGKSNVLGNINLKPEITIGKEIGAELRFFKDRIGIDLTYYNQTTKDVIIQFPVPYSTGHAAQISNGAEIVNKGFEALITIIPIRLKDFQWTSSFNFSHNKNTVTKLANGLKEVEIETGFGNPGVFAIVGKPFGALYGTTWERNANGQLIIGDNGRPIATTTTSYVGNAYPQWTGGFRNTFTYKAISLSGLIDIRQGGVIWNGTMARLNALGKSSETEDRERTYIIEGVKADGTPNDKAISARDYWRNYKGDGATVATEENVKDASWVRLRELTLSYSLKNISFLKYFKSIDFSITGRNLWLKTPYKGIDPDQSLVGAGSNYGGVDWFGTPNTKSLNIGVRFNL